MKYLKYITIIVLFIGFSAACGTSKRIPAKTVVLKERVETKLVPLVVPDRTAVLKAKLECDSLNRVRMAWYEQSADKGVASSISLSNDGVLESKVVYITDTLYLPSEHIYVEVPVDVPVLVEKEFTSWQRMQINFGRLALVAVTGYCLLAIKFKGISLFQTLLNFVLKLFK